MLETVHHYPRRLRWSFEVISAMLVLITALIFGRTLIQWLWATYGVDRSFVGTVPGLAYLISLVGVVDARRISVADVQRTLVWLTLALFGALVLRNALPTIRTSTRGILVEFFGAWLPIRWEDLRALRVTQDASGKRFVLLVETHKRALTGWHRLYAVLYRLGWRRSFYISSSISNFEDLVRTILNETDRAAHVVQGVAPLRPDERRPSLLMSLLLSPTSFFVRRSAADDAAVAASAVAADSPVIRGVYPARIGRVLAILAACLAALAATGYVLILLRLAAIQFPLVARLAQDQGIDVYLVPNVLWALIGAHILLGLGLLFARGLPALLPAIESRPEGLAVQQAGGWKLLPWASLDAIIDTELAPGNHVLLLQVKHGLSWPHRFASLLYTGNLRPGLIVTSAISHFEPLMQRIVVEVTRAQAAHPTPRSAPLLRTDAHSSLIHLALRPGAAIDRLVAEAREEDPPPPLTPRRILHAARPMAAVALLPALLLIADVALRQGQVPGLGLLLSAVLLWVIGMVEWPVISMAAQVFDEGAAASPEGSRGVLLYPVVQLPRILALLAALIVLICAAHVPFFSALPLLLWLAAIGWSFLLTAGLWESLYEWHGTQLLVGGIAPVVYQLLVLLAYLAVR